MIGCSHCGQTLFPGHITFVRGLLDDPNDSPSPMHPDCYDELIADGVLPHHYHMVYGTEARPEGGYRGWCVKDLDEAVLLTLDEFEINVESYGDDEVAWVVPVYFVDAVGDGPDELELVEGACRCEGTDDQTCSCFWGR